jgi:DNA-directed RNA polymerase subunit RPC12/RpoP
MNTGKVLGLLLIVGSIGLCLLAALWVGVGYAGGNYTNLAAPVLGLGLAFIVAAPLAGAGVFLFVRGRREAVQFAEVEKERQLLGMIQARGQVQVSDAALELDAGRDEVRTWIYDLVDKGFFSGYVNWDEGTLYSQDASQLKDNNRCPNCGGQVELVGKGVVQCPYCGAEIFLTD